MKCVAEENSPASLTAWHEEMIVCVWFAEGIRGGCLCQRHPCGWGAPGCCWVEGNSDEHFYGPIALSQCVGTLCRTISSGALGFREKGLAWEEKEMGILF